MPATGWQECSASQSIPIGSSGPRQQNWMLQPKFQHGSLGETYLLSPSAASSPRGPETAAGCSTDGRRPSSSTGDGAND